mmetsp:Transcript_54383/g.100458  ORF Transcript_54383/g.100458 Transcript_54383/m.100458 type:complete len:405 (+) Transcript_54383:117-1331(+)
MSESFSLRHWVVRLLSGKVLLERDGFPSVEELRLEVAEQLTIPASRVQLVSNDGVILEKGVHAALKEESESSLHAIVLKAPQAIVAERGGLLSLWDLSAMQRTSLLYELQEAITAISADATANRVMLGTAQGILRLYDRDRAMWLESVQAHEGAVLSLQALFDVGCAVSGEDCIDCLVKVWDIADGCIKCVQSLAGHTDAVRAVDVDFGAHLVASASDDTTVRLWRTRADGDAHIASLRGHELWVNAVCLQAEARRVLSASRDGTVRVWDIDRRLCLHILQPQHLPGESLRETLPACVALGGGPRTALMGLAACPKSGMVMASDTRGSLHFWNLRTLLYEGAFKCTSARCFYGRVHADFSTGRALVDFDPLLFLVDINAREVLSVSEPLRPDAGWIPCCWDVSH